MSCEDDEPPTIFRLPNLAFERGSLYGGGYQFLDDLSKRDRRRLEAVTDPQAAPLGLTRAALNTGVRDREATFRAAGYPPKVFISYRWESEDLKRWVSRLARHIESRGFRVILDQDAEALADSDPIEVGRYISVIVECEIIVCVVTPRYVAGLVPGAWLFEERQLMNLLARRGATIVRVLRDGPSPPTEETRRVGDFDISKGVAIEIPLPDHEGFTVDMRGGSVDRFSVLDGYLEYSGPRLPSELERPFREWLNQVARKCESGDLSAARAEFAEGRCFAETTEYRRLAAHLALAEGDSSRAAELAAMAVSEDTATVETRIDLAMLLHELGEHRAALYALARLPWWLGEEWSWRVHFQQGDYLDDLGSYVAALAHLEYSLVLSGKYSISPPTTQGVAALRNTLGYVYLFRFGAPDDALPHLEAAWRDDPNADNGVNLIVCHTAQNEYDSARRLWRKVKRTLDRSERARFAHIPHALATRSLPAPVALAALPGVTSDAWHCPACSARLLMAETTYLCASCGTAFEGTSACPCCATTGIAGAGALTPAGAIPPKCPICSAGVPMQRGGAQPSRP